MRKPKRKEPLSDLKVKRAKATGSTYEIPDGRGLFLRVSAEGTKTWCSRYGTLDGQGRRLTIGHYPALSLSEARAKNAAVQVAVKRGEDPAVADREAIIARRQAPTFADLFREYQEVELRDTPSSKDRKRMIEANVLPEWGNRKAASITRRDCVLLIDGIRERAPVMANRVQSLIVRIFNFACERGVLEKNQLAGLPLGSEKSRSRVLEDDEIRGLWFGLDKPEVDCYILTKLALKAVLLTGARPGEVSGMTWAEIHGDVWRLPQERSKTDVEIVRPILPMMAAVLETAKPISADSEFVFRAAHHATSHVKVGTVAQALRRHKALIGMQDPPYRPHDLRRTARTRWASLGVDEITSEKLLGHTLGGMAKIYNQHSYLPQMRQALAKWERRLQEILGLVQPAAVVVPFPERQ